MKNQLGQFMTPEWAAQALVERYYPGLSMHDQVVEPACGEGAFLRVLPDFVPAMGVEIDPALAERARLSSGRDVLVGDFCEIDLPVRPKLLVGNPPFKLCLIEAFLARAVKLLPPDGEVGFILPCYTLQTAATVERMSKSWAIAQDMIPRNLFPGLKWPLCFARFHRGRRSLVGFALYHEAAGIQQLRTRYRQLLAQGERSVWAAVTRAAMAQLGGSATLDDLYAEIQGSRPTENRYWKEQVRKVLQRIGHRTGRGCWRIGTAA